MRRPSVVSHTHSARARCLVGRPTGRHLSVSVRASAEAAAQKRETPTAAASAARLAPTHSACHACLPTRPLQHVAFCMWPAQMGWPVCHVSHLLPVLPGRHVSDHPSLPPVLPCLAAFLQELREYSMQLHTKAQAPKEGKAKEPKQQRPVRL